MARNRTPAQFYLLLIRFQLWTISARFLTSIIVFKAKGKRFPTWPDAFVTDSCKLLMQPTNRVVALLEKVRAIRPSWMLTLGAIQSHDEYPRIPSIWAVSLVSLDSY